MRNRCRPTTDNAVQPLHPVDRATALRRLQQFRRDELMRAELATIGFLVTAFTNDELHAIADDLAIGETMTLRAVGLLADNEGFDGRGASGGQGPC